MDSWGWRVDGRHEEEDLEPALQEKAGQAGQPHLQVDLQQDQVYQGAADG